MLPRPSRNMAGSHTYRSIDFPPKVVRASELNPSLACIAGTVPVSARTFSLAFPYPVGRKALQSERPVQCKTNAEPRHRTGSVMPTAQRLCRTRGAPPEMARPPRASTPGTEIQMVNVLEVNLELRRRYGEPGGVRFAFCSARSCSSPDCMRRSVTRG